VNDTVPTRVALYSHASGEPRRIAEFRWNPEAGVTLDILDPQWSRLARQYYEHGVELGPEARMVLPSEGPTFMRALLQPFRMSYYSLVDESPKPE
jgi:hypothetical protein